jgi:hypothetical protein
MRNRNTQKTTPKSTENEKKKRGSRKEKYRKEKKGRRQGCRKIEELAQNKEPDPSSARRHGAQLVTNRVKIQLHRGERKYDKERQHKATVVHRSHQSTLLHYRNETHTYLTKDLHLSITSLAMT